MTPAGLVAGRGGGLGRWRRSAPGGRCSSGRGSRRRGRRRRRRSGGGLGDLPRGRRSGGGGEDLTAAERQRVRLTKGAGAHLVELVLRLRRPLAVELELAAL